jgi:hypothetical protein
MEGVFNVSLRKAPRWNDRASWEGLTKEQQLEQALKGELLQEVRSKNQINDNFAAYTFRNMMQGGDISNPYDYNDIYGNRRRAAFAALLLQSHDNDVGYTEHVWETDEIPQFPNASDLRDATDASSKRFISDQIDTKTLISLDQQIDDGREGITYKGRWLYLPYQSIGGTNGAGANVRSISVLFSAFENNYASDSYASNASLSRTVLTNDEGEKINIRKTKYTTLLVEWAFTILNV